MDRRRAGGRPRRILVLSKAGVGTMMSSPGIRALNIARVLAREIPEAEVVLAVPGSSDLVPDAPFRVKSYTNRTLPALMLGFDTVISQGFPPTTLPLFFGRRFVMDFFTNFMIEGLEYRKEHVTPAVRRAWLETQRAYLNLQLTLADFVICANERQRDAWLGMMSSLGLITGRVYDRDNTLRGLVEVAAYGVRPERLRDADFGLGIADAHAAPTTASPDEASAAPMEAQPGAYDGAQGHQPGEPETSGITDESAPARSAIGPAPRAGVRNLPEGTLILWNGGILKWYDPMTLLRAVARVVERRPDVKLVFLGTRYPVAGFDPGNTVSEAFELARGLGLLDRHVFFNDGWLPYDESGRQMARAAVGVSTYYDNLETHFSYRTRVIDFLWAQVPTIVTRGDVLAEMIERRGLGIAVPERDVEALEAALTRLLEDQGFYRSCKANLAVIQDELGWERTLAPLVRFCRAETAIARGKWTRLPDVLTRTAQYALARLIEQRRAARQPGRRAPTPPRASATQPVTSA